MATGKPVKPAGKPVGTGYTCDFEFGFEFNRFPPVSGQTGPINRYRRIINPACEKAERSHRDPIRIGSSSRNKKSLSGLQLDEHRRLMDWTIGLFISDFLNNRWPIDIIT